MLDFNETIDCKVFNGDGDYIEKMSLMLSEGYKPVTVLSVFSNRYKSDHPEFWRDQPIDTCSGAASMNNRYKFLRCSEHLRRINKNSPLSYQRNQPGKGLEITVEEFYSVLTCPGIRIRSRLPDEDDVSFEQYEKNMRQILLTKLLGFNETSEEVIACENNNYAKVCVRPGTKTPIIFPIRVAPVNKDSKILCYLPIDCNKVSLVGVKKLNVGSSSH